MDDEITKPSMPPQPETRKLPQADPTQILVIQLGQKFDSFASEVRADMETLKSEGQRTNLRLTRQEVRMDDVETRLTRNNGRVKDVSDADLSQAAALAEEKTAREALAAEHAKTAAKVDTLDKKQDLQLAILGRLDRITSNPLVKTLGAMLLTALITYLATHYGIKVPQ